MNIWVTSLAKGQESISLGVASNAWDDYEAHQFLAETEEVAYLTDNFGTVYPLKAPTEEHIIRPGEVYRLVMEFNKTPSPEATSLTLHTQQFMDLTVFLKKPTDDNLQTESDK